MALKSTLLAHGTVLRVKSREFVSHKTGEPVRFVFHDAVVMGDHTMIELRLSDQQLPVVRELVGELITATIELATFRDEVTAELVDIIHVGQPLDLELVPIQ